MLPRNRKQGFGISIKLLFVVRGVYDSSEPKHHALVSAYKVIQELLCFFALLFHVVRNYCAKVVVGVLLPLPIRNVRFNTKQLAFYFSHSFVRRDRDNIKGKEQISVQFTQSRYKAIFDI